MQSTPDPSEHTDFGYQQVPLREKQGQVNAVFHRVAQSYDLMNDVMSLGIHRLWKRQTLARLHLQPNQLVLDVAGGTGDMAQLMWPQVQPQGQVVIVDINSSMLEVGRDRLLDQGICHNISLVQANAEQLPFENHFDHLTIAFGLRNVPRKEKALRSFYQALKPGGRLSILEFSHPTVSGLKSLYDLYSFKLLPKFGKWLAKDEASYQYLVESIRKHPTQPQLCTLMRTAGFEDCRYHNFSGGIVALHQGIKY